MFKPQAINVLLVLALLGGIWVGIWKLAGAQTIIENPVAKNVEPVIPAPWSEQVWPTADKLGKPTVATTLLAIPDWAARDPSNHATIEHLTLARFPDFDLRGMNLEQTINEIAKATQVSIVVDWEELAKQGIKRDSPLYGSSYQSPHLDGVLNEVFKRVYGVEGKLGYDVSAGIVRVTTKEALDRRNLFTRIYDVADILVAMDKREGAIYERLHVAPPTSLPGDPLAGKMAELSRIIRECVLKDSWKTVGGPASVEPVSFTLVVTQTPEGHAQIELLLKQLRLVLQG